MIDRIRDWAARRGYLAAFTDTAMAEAVLEDLEKHRRAKELDESFYLETLASLKTADRLPPNAVLVVLAVPRPAHRLVFQFEDAPIEAILPPTYLEYRRMSQSLGEEIAALLGLADPPKPLNLPLKSLAAKAGLVRYGRNNITYAPGMGSYLQLAGFALSGTAPPAQPPVEDPLLPGCRDCSACRSACPTGAIGSDRFLLHAERCLTYLNEGPDPWPAHLPAGVHHCLVGCLRCQEECPYNRGLLHYEKPGTIFDQEETARILEAEPDDSDLLWKRIQEKLNLIGLSANGGIIGRNLRALLEAGGENRAIR